MWFGTVRYLPNLQETKLIFTQKSNLLGEAPNYKSGFNPLLVRFGIYSQHLFSHCKNLHLTRALNPRAQ